MAAYRTISTEIQNQFTEKSLTFGDTSYLSPLLLANRNKLLSYVYFKRKCEVLSHTPTTKRCLFVVNW